MELQYLIYEIYQVMYLEILYNLNLILLNV